MNAEGLTDITRLKIMDKVFAHSLQASLKNATLSVIVLEQLEAQSDRYFTSTSTIILVSYLWQTMDLGKGKMDDVKRDRHLSEHKMEDEKKKVFTSQPAPDTLSIHDRYLGKKCKKDVTCSKSGNLEGMLTLNC
jgi:hypothetical protein